MVIRRKGVACYRPPPIVSKALFAEWCCPFVVVEIQLVFSSIMVTQHRQILRNTTRGQRFVIQVKQLLTILSNDERVIEVAI